MCCQKHAVGWEMKRCSCWDGCRNSRCVLVSLLGLCLVVDMHKWQGGKYICLHAMHAVCLCQVCVEHVPVLQQLTDQVQVQAHAVAGELVVPRSCRLGDGQVHQGMPYTSSDVVLRLCGGTVGRCWSSVRTA